MSIYKVVGNTYWDLLDYVNVQYKRNNNNIDRVFANMSLADFKQVVLKIANIYQRIDILQLSQQEMYKSKTRNGIFFMVLLVTVMIGIAIGTVFMYIYQLKQQGDNVSIIAQIEQFLVYFIMYLFVHSITFLLFFNIWLNDGTNGKTRKLFEEVEQNLSSLQKYLGFNERMTPIFMFIAYKNTESSSSYNKIWFRHYNILKEYIVNAPAKTERLTNANEFNYELFSTNHRDTIRGCVSSLFDNGKGYTNLTQVLIQLSPPMLVKEIRAILVYYNNLVKRVENASDIQSLDDNKKKAIERHVIPALEVIPMIDDIKHLNPYNRIDLAPANVDVNNLIEQQLSNSKFNQSYTNLQKLYAYTMIYCTQLWTMKLTSVPDFRTMYSDVFSRMPHLLEIKDTSATDSAFMIDINSAFRKHFEANMVSRLSSASTAQPQSLTKMTTNDFKTLIHTETLLNQTTHADFHTLCTSTLNDLQDIFDKYYTYTLIQTTTDYWFALDPLFILQNADKFQEKAFGSSIITCIPYIKEFVYATQSSVTRPEYIDTFKNKMRLSSVKSDIIVRVAPIAVDMKLRLVENSAYIIDTIKSKNNNVKDEDVAVINDVLTSIDAKVTQYNNIAPPKETESKFLELDQFIAKVDAATYYDIKTGLDSDWFKDVISTFYNNVSNSVNAADKKTRDIFFEQDKQLKLSKIAFIATAVILTLVVVYYLLTVRDSYYELKAQYANKELTAQQSKAKTESYVNLALRATVPVVVLIFIICILWSIIQKTQVRNLFNRDTIDRNTSSLRDSVSNLYNHFIELDQKVRENDGSKPLKSLPQITLDDKTVLYTNICNILDKYEKCNYLLAVQQGDIPFPYAEITIDGVMIILIIICMLIVIQKVNPMLKIQDVKEMFRLKDRSEFMNDEELSKEIKPRAKCHDNDIDSILLALKIVFFLLIVTFLLFYSSKVVQTTSDYQSGLYNSVFFTNSECIN